MGTAPSLGGGQMCCQAMTADCLACSAGVSVEKYCQDKPKTSGCVTTAPSLRGGQMCSRLREPIVWHALQECLWRSIARTHPRLQAARSRCLSAGLLQEVPVARCVAWHWRQTVWH